MVVAIITKIANSNTLPGSSVVCHLDTYYVTDPNINFAFSHKNLKLCH